MAAPAGIQGQTLEITVICCNKLKDVELFTIQDPYVCLDYAGRKYRTRTSTGGGTNPNFNEKIILNLMEGLHEISVQVWNSNAILSDKLIGWGKIQLNKVLSEGFDDTAWSLVSGKSERYSGEVKLIMHYEGAKKQEHPAAPYGPPPPYHVPSYLPTSSSYSYPYGQYPPASHHQPLVSHHQPPTSHYPPLASHHQPLASHYPTPASHYPPPASQYPPPANSYAPPPTAPPQPGVHAYLSSTCPPHTTYQSQTYLPSQPSHTYRPAHRGFYPPPPPPY